MNTCGCADHLPSFNIDVAEDAELDEFQKTA